MMYREGVANTQCVELRSVPWPRVLSCCHGYWGGWLSLSVWGKLGAKWMSFFVALQRCCSHNHIVISAAHHDQATLLGAWSGCCVHHMCCWRRVCLGQQHCAAVAAQDCQLAAELVIAGSWGSDYENAPANGACVHHAPPLPQVPVTRNLHRSSIVCA